MCICMYKLSHFVSLAIYGSIGVRLSLEALPLSFSSAENSSIPRRNSNRESAYDDASAELQQLCHFYLFAIICWLYCFSALSNEYVRAAAAVASVTMNATIIPVSITCHPPRHFLPLRIHCTLLGTLPPSQD